MSDNAQLTSLCGRFRGFYPAVIDVKTARFSTKTDALFEIAAITLKMSKQDRLVSNTTLHFHAKLFVDANLQPEALAFSSIDPNGPGRDAVSEHEVLCETFRVVRKGIKTGGYSRTIIVTHNTNFDHSFMMVATGRAPLERSPFHPLTTFDTAALAGLAFEQTVLPKACQTVDMDFGSTQAHSMLYGTERIAMLFCKIVNRWKRLEGWPLPVAEGVQSGRCLVTRNNSGIYSEAIPRVLHGIHKGWC